MNSQTTRRLRVSQQAKEACVRFWTWRVVFIVVAGAMVGQFLGSYLLPSPTQQFHLRLKSIDERTYETKQQVKQLNDRVEDIQIDVETIKQKQKTNNQ